MIFQINFIYIIVAITLVCTKIEGTDAIVYLNVGYSGSYMDVTNMDESSCKCSQQSRSFSGTFAPLNEELSVHFRGPLRLLQFGVYYPNSGTAALKKREEAKSHEHMKRYEASAQVTSTTYVSNAKTSDSTASSIPPISPGASKQAVGGTSSRSWGQYSYFSPGSGSNVVFLNHNGPWSQCFGNGLAYCASNGVDAANNSEVLGDVVVGSNCEFIIFSGSECKGNDCGYYRNSGIPAYHGFGGADKMFVFEFSMPDQTSTSATQNDNMPAIWLLNAKIPRTMQYGNDECSCWSSGCGEFDIFEIISDGATDLTNQIHDREGSVGGGGGSTATLSRPTSGSMKAAVIFNDLNQTIHIVKLPDSATFGGTIESSTISQWLKVSGDQVKLAS